MRLIDADELLDHVIDIHCKNCERRKGVKNGKYRIIYEVGDVPCRSCGIDDMKSYLEDAPTADPDAERIARIRKHKQMTNAAAMDAHAIEIGLVDPQNGGENGS